MRQIKLGIIGCGRQATKLALAISELSDEYEIVHLADSDRLKADTFAQNLNNKASIKISNNHLDLLEDPNVEAVYISTPSDSHIEIAEQALQKGLDILLEKPHLE